MLLFSIIFIKFVWFKEYFPINGVSYTKINIAHIWIVQLRQTLSTNVLWELCLCFQNLILNQDYRYSGGRAVFQLQGRSVKTSSEQGHAWMLLLLNLGLFCSLAPCRNWVNNDLLGIFESTRNDLGHSIFGNTRKCDANEKKFKI